MAFVGYNQAYSAQCPFVLANCNNSETANKGIRPAEDISHAKLTVLGFFFFVFFLPKKAKQHEKKRPSAWVWPVAAFLSLHRLQRGRRRL